MMFSRLRTLIFIFCCGVLGTSLNAQQITFSLVDKAVIIDRVRESPPKNQDREQKIKDLFASVGCAASTVEQPVKHAKTPNVICRLQGETNEEIIVGAHYDKVSAGTGTIDNWSGASLLASLYAGLAGQKRHHTFVFVAFTGEEEGLIGSEFFVKHMSKEEVANTRAMINMDTLGLSYTRIWAHRADKNLVQAMLAVAGSLKIPVGEMNVEQVGSTDSESFAARHIPRMTIHSLTQEKLSVLHSPEDKFKELRPDDYYDTYRLMETCLAYLDVKPASMPAGSPPAGHPKN